MKKFLIVVSTIALLCIITCPADAGLFDRIKKSKEQRIEYSRQVPVRNSTLFRGYPPRANRLNYQKSQVKRPVSTDSLIIRPSQILTKLRGLDKK